MTGPAPPDRPSTLNVFLVAGEESGDRLGADLMRALRQRAGGEVSFAGVGGRAMAAEGVASLYSIDDLAMIGFMSVPRRAPGVVRRQRFTARTRRAIPRVKPGLSMMTSTCGRAATTVRAVMRWRRTTPGARRGTDMNPIIARSSIE